MYIFSCASDDDGDPTLLACAAIREKEGGREMERRMGGGRWGKRETKRWKGCENERSDNEQKGWNGRVERDKSVGRELL